jgi:predicted metal-dependent hydrolase
VADAPDVPAVVRRGVRLFNRGRYAAANELWEAAWRDAPATDRGFLEGLVQLAAALHLRTRRGGTRGAVHLLSQALVGLDEYAPTAHGVDIEKLLAEFSTYLDVVKAANRPHRFADRWAVPRIHLR